MPISSQLNFDCVQKPPIGSITSLAGPGAMGVSPMYIVTVPSQLPTASSSSLCSGPGVGMAIAAMSAIEASVLDASGFDASGLGVSGFAASGLGALDSEAQAASPRA